MKHHNEKKKRKLFTKARLIKAGKGSISILLCLLITPFLSIALGLVEYARYQEVLEVTDEIYELTGVSVLADYDTYINQRFGFLATAQTGALGNGAESLFQQNAKMMGKQIDVNDPSVSGKFPLKDDVLKKQLVDFSELTVPTAVLGEDFKLQELLNKLTSLSGFQDTMDMVKGLRDLTKALKGAVEKLEELQTSLNNLSNLVQSAITGANQLAQKLAELFKTLSEKKIMLPENATNEEINAALESFCKDYLKDLKLILQDASDLIKVLKQIKTTAGNIVPNINAFIDEVEKANGAFGDIAGAGSDDNGGEGTQAATSVLEDILEELNKLVEDTLSDIKDGAIETLKQAVDDIINTSLAEVGLDKAMIDRYKAFGEETYFTLPLSDFAKADLAELLKIVQELYDENLGAADLKSALLNYFKDLLVPNLKIGDTTITDLANSVGGIAENAKNVLKNKLSDALINFINKLISMVKGLFDLKVFSDSSLNAWVDSEAAGNSPYQNFLNAVGDMFTAINKFTESNGFFDRLNIVKILTHMGDLFDAIFNVFQEVGNIVGSMLQSIGQLGGGMQALYEKILLSGYLSHNLPCRCNAKIKQFGQTDGTITSKVELTGEGLTGFSYDDIARPDSYEGQIYDDGADAKKTTFERLSQLILNMQNGSGSDKMFKGAELEYIVAGTNSETVNQIVVFFDIYFLRLLIDLPSVFMDSSVNGIAAAATVASWVVYILYILVEPFCDMLILVNGGEVPLFRSKCWLTPTKIGEFADKIATLTLGDNLKESLSTSLFNGVEDKMPEDKDNGMKPGNPKDSRGEMNYQTHVLIVLILLTPEQDQFDRLQSLIEMECKVKYGDDFTLTRAYTTVEISADVTFRPFFDLGIASGGGSLLPSSHITRTVSY